MDSRLAVSKKEKIAHLLGRNTETIVQTDHLKVALESGRKLRVKFGIDPTSSDIHLGHAVVLHKLKEFQELGHTIVFIIGDFTAQIGDPSGKSAMRPPLTEREVQKNMESYLEQAAMILNIEKAEIHYNSSWLSKLQGRELITLLSLVSVQQLLEREDFEKRLSLHESIRVHELLYPILQGYDSVMVKADVECGAVDQLLNFLVARDLMGKCGMEPQDILTVQLLLGLEGKQKMSKSLGNYIALNDSPKDKYGRTMSIPDAAIGSYLKLTTSLPIAEIEKYEEELKVESVNPKHVKERLAYEIVKRYHGEKEAKKAAEEFDKVFSKKEAVEFPVIKIPRKEITLLELVLCVWKATGKAGSKSEGRRLIEQGGVRIDSSVQKNPLWTFTPRNEIIKIGKKDFFRLETR